MNQKRWSGFTAAIMLSTLSLVPVSRADQAQVPESQANPQLGTTPDSGQQPAEVSGDTSIAASPAEGSQAQAAATSNTLVAKVLGHRFDEHSAATLYVRNIPVLTFLGSEDDSTSTAPVANSISALDNLTTSTEAADKVAVDGSKDAAASEAVTASTDPVWRAMNVATLINHLDRKGLDATEIDVSWDTKDSQYVIQLGDQKLAAVNSETILPDTTGDLAQDALQATNRLRRLLGAAPPLSDIEQPPAPAQPPQVAAVREVMTGTASWYGPGFNGRLTASGEIFNQNAMTAAHRWLPFGTRVRVTNMNNGESTIVTINDRGPYVGGRVIDLSAAAAQTIGMMGSGTAPVRLEVL